MNRLAAVAALSALALSAHAQPPGGMSGAGMQRMAQEMRACRENIDQAALERLTREGEALRAEIRTLCAAGRRDTAQDMAATYGRKVAKDPALRAVAECGEKMPGIMPRMPPSMTAPTAQELTNGHVCDDL